MLTFLFWNLAKRDVAEVVAALALENKVDIILLAENRIPVSKLLRLLNSPADAKYNFVPPPISDEPKIDIYFGFPSEFLKPKKDTRRATIRAVTLPARQEFLLCGVHFQSRAVWTEEDQALESANLNRIIREEERALGHTRTLVVGDLNMNPFSLGVTAASGFNAVMTREVALRGSRTLADVEHPFFFNPMWSKFSDGELAPSGTYYLNPSGYQSNYWNILDQVLIRPDLIQTFDHSSVVARK